MRRGHRGNRLTVMDCWFHGDLAGQSGQSDFSVCGPLSTTAVADADPIKWCSIFKTACPMPDCICDCLYWRKLRKNQAFFKWGKREKVAYFYQKHWKSNRSLNTHTKRTGHLILAPVNSLLSCTLNLALMSLAVDRPKDRVLDSVSKGNLASGVRPDLVKDWWETATLNRWHSQAAQGNFSVKYKTFLTEHYCCTT